MPEIVVHSRLIARPIFVPSVGNFRQGMIVCIPLFVDTLPGRPTGAAFRDALLAHYNGAEDIHIVEPVPSGRLERSRSTKPTRWNCRSTRTRFAARPSSSRGSTISAKAHQARRCKISS